MEYIEYTENRVYTYTQYTGYTEYSEYPWFTEYKGYTTYARYTAQNCDPGFGHFYISEPKFCRLFFKFTQNNVLKCIYIHNI